MTDKLYSMPPRSKTVIVPEGGWKPHTVYLVWVAVGPHNPIHRALLNTGFIQSNGEFGSYCEVWCNTYDESIHAKHFHFLEVIQELCPLGD